MIEFFEVPQFLKSRVLNNRDTQDSNHEVSVTKIGFLLLLFWKFSI